MLFPTTSKSKTFTYFHQTIFTLKLFQSYSTRVSIPELCIKICRNLHFNTFLKLMYAKVWEPLTAFGKPKSRSTRITSWLDLGFCLFPFLSLSLSLSLSLFSSYLTLDHGWQASKYIPNCIFNYLGEHFLNTENPVNELFYRTLALPYLASTSISNCIVMNANRFASLTQVA
jgi:hypothetical protein